MASIQTTKRRSLTGGLQGDDLHADLLAFVDTQSADTPLLSERKLAAQYAVSHGTVRHVLDQLEREGKVYRVHGKGTFVAAVAPVIERQTVVYADVWSEADHIGYSRLIRGLTLEAKAQSLRLQVLCCRSNDRNDFEDLIAEVERPDVVGVVLPYQTRLLFRKLQQAKPSLRIVSATSSMPSEDTASVILSKYALGRQAITYLLNKDAMKIALVHNSLDCLAGARATLEAANFSGAFHDIRDSGNPEGVAQQLQTLKVDGIAFADDRCAAAVLAAMDAPSGGRPNVISFANTGERLLPEWVARLAFDMLQIGRLTMRVLATMGQNDPYQNTEVHVRPRLVEPE